MNSQIFNILKKLEQGQITSQQAIKYINKYQPNSKPTKTSSKLKITIIDSDEGKSIRLPGIPFWIITSLGNTGLKIAKFVALKSKTIDDETKQYLRILDDFDIREIFYELKNQPPFDLVNIEEKDGDMVKISIL